MIYGARLFSLFSILYLVLISLSRFNFPLNALRTRVLYYAEMLFELPVFWHFNTYRFATYFILFIFITLVLYSIDKAAPLLVYLHYINGIEYSSLYIIVFNVAFHNLWLWSDASIRWQSAQLTVQYTHFIYELWWRFKCPSVDHYFLHRGCAHHRECSKVCDVPKLRCA